MISTCLTHCAYNGIYVLNFFFLPLRFVIVKTWWRIKNTKSRPILNNRKIWNPWWVVLRGCATTSWMNISELLLYFVVIKWVEGRPGSIWHCQLAERYWLLLFCFLPFLFVVSSLLLGAVPFFPALFVPYTSHKETFLIVLYINRAGQMNKNVIISNPYTVF